MPKRTRNHREALIEDLRNDPQFSASYLTAAMEESMPVFLRALRDVAEAHRMSFVAGEAQLSRETLYRTLSQEGNPRLSSLTGILRAVGMKIRLEAENTAVLSYEHAQQAQSSIDDNHTGVEAEKIEQTGTVGAVAFGNSQIVPLPSRNAESEKEIAEGVLAYA